MRAVLLATAFLSTAACSNGRSGRERCPEAGDFDPGEPLVGFRPIAFSLGTNGGYLGASISFGDCHESEGHTRIYRISETMTGLEVEPIDPSVALSTRMVVLASGNEVALAQDGESTVRIHSPPVGTDTIAIPGPVADVQAAGDGWIVSASSGGSFRIEGGTHALTPLPAASSNCGGPGAGRWLICEGSAILVVGTDGVLVATLSVPAAPTFIAGADSAGLAILGNSDLVATISGDVIDMLIPLDGEANQAWSSLDGSRAVLAGPTLEQHLVFANGAVESVSALDDYGGRLVDASFAPGRAFKGYDNGTIAVRDTSTGSESVFPAETSTWDVEPVLIERMGSGKIVFAPTHLVGEARAGDVVYLPVYDVQLDEFVTAIPLVLE